MEILLTKQCKALIGSLGKGYGYFIQRRRSYDGSVRFFSQRSKHPPIPADGHLRFIFACAQLAQMKTHITDIIISRQELLGALWEAGWCVSRHVPEKLKFLHTSDVLTLKEKLYL